MSRRRRPSQARQRPASAGPVELYPAPLSLDQSPLSVVRQASANSDYINWFRERGEEETVTMTADPTPTEVLYEMRGKINELVDRINELADRVATLEAAQPIGTAASKAAEEKARDDAVVALLSRIYPVKLISTQVADELGMTEERRDDMLARLMRLAEEGRVIMHLPANTEGKRVYRKFQAAAPSYGPAADWTEGLTHIPSQY